MSDVNARIEQFRRATQQNPTDPLAFFSLGRALLDGGMHADAVLALQRALAMDAKLSRAYQLLARAQLSLDRKSEALDTLRQGTLIAHQRGDLMPKNEMIAMLVELGEPAPEFGTPQTAVVGEGQVFDLRTQRPGTRMARQPFKNPLGKIIYENVSAESWKEAIAHGTKVINELRLPLNDPAAQKVWDQHIVEFLNLREKVDEAGIKI